MAPQRLELLCQSCIGYPHHFSGLLCYDTCNNCNVRSASSEMLDAEAVEKTEKTLFKLTNLTIKLEPLAQDI